MTYLFVAGTPRSGGGAITHSLDYHPEVLVWPFHFKYFPFFRIISKGRDHVDIQELNHALIDVFRDVLVNVVMIRDLKMSVGLEGADIQDKDLSIGEFDFEQFRDRLLFERDQQMDAFGYLTKIFDTFQLSLDTYAGREVKYRLINLTSARGLDWTRRTELAEHKIIFPYRDPKQSYQSLKNRYFSKDSQYNLLKAFSPFREKSLLYWLEHFRRLSHISDQFSPRKNFLVIPLTELHKDPHQTIDRLRQSLVIAKDPALSRLSILGIPYGGNANQDNINTGKISRVPSKPAVPLTRFESTLFDEYHLFQSLRCTEDFATRTGKSRLVFHAWLAAFKETDCKNITRGRSPVLCPLCARLGILAALLMTILLTKSQEWTMKVLRKHNPHMEEMTFWD